MKVVLIGDSIRMGYQPLVDRKLEEPEGPPDNDLHDVILSNDFAKCLSEDGCHMTAFGNEVLSDAVVEAIRLFMN